MYGLHDRSHLDDLLLNRRQHCRVVAHVLLHKVVHLRLKVQHVLRHVDGGLDLLAHGHARLLQLLQTLHNLVDGLHGDGNGLPHLVWEAQDTAGDHVERVLQRVSERDHLRQERVQVVQEIQHRRQR